MKVFIMGLTVLTCAIAAWGEVFRMDRKGDTVVEIRKTADEYKVTCKFRPQTKFDKAVNAKFNDAKGDFLCKRGLARYLKVATNETLEVAGLYSAAPVQTDGERLCYSFGVPVSGCMVRKAKASPARKIAQKDPDIDMDAKPKHPNESWNADVVDSATRKDMANADIKTSSFLCVAKYKEINGERKTISRKEYRGGNFRDMNEFNRFCQDEFARIRAQGDANLRAVRKGSLKSGFCTGKAEAERSTP